MASTFRWIAIITALSGNILCAQNSPLLTKCMAKAMTQLAMNTCAGEELARADAALNAVYQKVLLAARDEPRAVEKIKASERAWIAYRDSYLEATYPAEDKQANYGSIYPMEAALLQAELTQQQASALKKLLKQHSNSQ
jgi:uncharacterized protein YecT (DUF1311 family)